MSEVEARRVRRVTLLTAIAAVVFCGFFQAAKSGPVRDINPFGDDPCDAVGSFAIQIALLVGLLTLGWALRLAEGPAQAAKARLIFRGNVIVVAAIALTLAADAVAELVRPAPPSHWGRVLGVGLAGMFLLAGICAAALAVVSRGIVTDTPPPDLTPTEGIEDVWALVRVPVAKARRLLPRGLVRVSENFSGDRLFSRAAWLNPRIHWWRFACVLGALAGVGVLLAQLQEGLPPTLAVGLAVAAIFIVSEFVATVAGFALLGGYLGLRPTCGTPRRG